MKIYPAIDIKAGNCVRLQKGEREKCTDYGDPVEMAKKWSSEGAQYLHLVDLDGAFEGKFINQDVVRRIVESVKIPVQMGGGIRTEQDIEERLDNMGISRVILGTVVHTRPELLKWAVARYSDRIAVAIDAKEGKVCISGWVESVEEDPVTLALRMKDLGVKNIIFTDVSRDGMMTGPNIERTAEMVKKTWINIIASGGISTLDDIVAVRGTGACGVILGKSLYSGAFTLKEAMITGK
jgi:phosphoribosylformimino-5-aminoimidazole carboxamide ribotide isomerase